MGCLPAGRMVAYAPMLLINGRPISIVAANLKQSRRVRVIMGGAAETRAGWSIQESAALSSYASLQR